MRETRAYADKIDLPPIYRGKVVLFTTFYKHQAYAGYCHSLALTAMVFAKLGIEWDYWPYSGDFHVERACNKALTNFLASDATDFVCIDSDEAWNTEGLYRLLTRPVEIVGGAYKKTNAWDEYTVSLKTDARRRRLAKARIGVSEAGSAARKASSAAARSGFMRQIPRT